jgi:hypothetical protein
MQDEYFKITGEIRRKIQGMLKSLGEVHESIYVKGGFNDEAEKLFEVMNALKGLDGPLEDLEHLVIVDGIHYKDSL